MAAFTTMHLKRICKLSDQLLSLSDKGFLTCNDARALMLNGVVRDCAYRLRSAAEEERRNRGTKEHREGGGPGKRPIRKRSGVTSRTEGGNS